MTKIDESDYADTIPLTAVRESWGVVALNQSRVPIELFNALQGGGGIKEDTRAKEQKTKTPLFGTRIREAVKTFRE